MIELISLFFRAWMDLYHTIKSAQKFIYITGWSVFTQINLVRGDDDTGTYLKAFCEYFFRFEETFTRSGRCSNPWPSS